MPVVYAVLTDRQYLVDRLALLGGPGATVLEHEAGQEHAWFRLRHGIAGGDLPQVIRPLLRGDLTVDRAERWRVDGGGYLGEVTVTVPGMPGELAGTFQLSGEGDRSTMLMSGSVSIPLPLVGGKVEQTVEGHLRALLDAEHDFATRWLAEHDAGPRG